MAEVENKENAISEEQSSSSAASCSTEKKGNEYSVIQTLGEGAFGEVLLIVDTKNPTCAVAMKKMACRLNEKGKIDLIRKEALLQKMLSKTGHDNVIRFIGMKNDESFYYLFLEYADGGELFDKIEPDVGMVPSRAQFYYRQLIDGLTFIHNHGIVHRDIKPENLLITSKHVLKITDFGLATVYRHDGKERLLTMPCGTDPYVAPEIQMHLKYRGEQVDVWSSAVVLVTLLTGQLPWQKASDCSAAYLNWITNTNLDEDPWKKIDVRGLSFLRGVLTDNVTKRSNLEKIRQHPWYTHNYGRVHFEGKKRRLEEDPSRESPSTQVQSVKRRHVDDGVIEGTSAKQRVSKKISSFSQPTNIDDMLLTQHIDMSQLSSNPLQNMVRRMTRFCVKTSMSNAIQRVAAEAEYAGYSVRLKGATQLLVMHREISMMVNSYSMQNADGVLKVMMDFRRSRGDGIQFKRMFVELRSRMEDLICPDGNDWLELCGLTPVEEPEINTAPVPVDA